MHTISGLYMKGSENYQGLFGVLSSTGVSTVKNLKLTNSYFECNRTTNLINEYDGVGGIAGQGAGKLDTIYCDAIVVNATRNAGGLIGSHAQSKAPLDVTNCWFDGKVTGAFFIGGIVGFAHARVAHTNVSDCLVTAELTGVSMLESTGASYVGGIMGRIMGGTISSCVVSGTLSGAGLLVYGIIGTGAGLSGGVPLVLTRCYNATNIEGYGYASAEKATGEKPAGVLRISQVKRMSEEDLKGTSAYFNTLLSFYAAKTNEEGKWVAVRPNAFVSLKSFTPNNQVQSIAGLTRELVDSDISWYDETKKEFVITTAAQLIGFAELCNGGNNFAGKTIKLGADIKVNSGLATDWAQGKNLPVNKWIPIGSDDNSKLNRAFAGTFDGQMHTISGLYTKSDGYYIGMFACLASDGSATVKNLKLTNSYFECTRTTDRERELFGVGGIVGQGAGTLDTIYCDAIVVSNCSDAGGLVGTQIQANAPLDVTNCWFNGNVTGTFWIGGILGFAHANVAYTNISDCLVTADLTSTSVLASTGNSYVGGITGRIMGGTIDSCVVTGTLTGTGGSVNGIFGMGSAMSEKAPLILVNCYNATNADTNGTASAQAAAGGKPAGVLRVSELMRISENDLKGIEAYYNTLLEFYVKTTHENGKWVTVKDNEFLGLKSFTLDDLVVDLSSMKRLSTDTDTSWYDETKKEFVITTAEQLYGFAQLCNAGTSFAGKTVKLGADIKVNDGLASEWEKGENLPRNAWRPIGSDVSAPFAGTFDGQMHTISGLYTKSDGSYLGLFGCLSEDGSATIKNVKLTNTYFECTRTQYLSSEKDGLGSIAGYGTGTLHTIYSDAILVNHTRNTGGLVGSQRLLNSKLDITNCWFNGTVTGTFWVGGIIGFEHGDIGYANITDCLVTADLTSIGTLNGSSYVGGIAGRHTSGTISSCVIIGNLTGVGSSVFGIHGMGTAYWGRTVEISKCYNATNVGNSTPIAVKADDDHPVAGVASVSELKKVSEDELKGKAAFFNTLLDFYIKATNEEGRWIITKSDGSIGLKSFTLEDEIENLAGLDRNPIVPDTSWYSADQTEFVITTAEQLYGFAQLCNAGTSFAGKTVKLGADITVNNGLASEWEKGENLPFNPWTPIGGGTNSNDNKGFAGTFDGQMHTISGLYTKSDGNYIGMFACLSTTGSATVKNLKLTNSYFESTRTGDRNLFGTGGIVGSGAGTLDTIYCDAIVVSKTQDAGGLVGTHMFKALDIKNCWFNGSVTGTNYVGGIIGYEFGADALGNGDICYANITDCLVTADLKGANYVGGIAGRFVAETISSCVVKGTLTGTGSAVNGFFGEVTANAKKELVLSKCYNATNAENGIPEDVRASELKKVTEDQLKGVNAYTNTLLDFYVERINEDGRWVAVEDDGFIGLKSFTDEDQIIKLTTEQIQSRILTADYSWYNNSKSEFIILTERELLGLAYVTNVNVNNNFKDKTVKLGANLKLNIGLAADWKEEANRPINSWTPISGGTDSKSNLGFAGTFDGQMHTISGLYTKSDGYYIGLFACLKTDGSATVKNLKLTNSYFESTNTADRVLYGTGGIAGSGAGKLDTIYCDAIVVSKTQDTGGLVGTHYFDALDVKNCWFAGSVTGTKYIGGIIGYEGNDASYTKNANITDCLVTADLKGTDAIGGIAGRFASGTISSCVAKGTLTGTGSAVNGIFGEVTVISGREMVLSKCYNATNAENGTTTGVNVSELKKVSEDQLVGTNARENTNLDFYDETSKPNGKWVIIDNEFVCLKSFASEIQSEDMVSLNIEYFEVQTAEKSKNLMELIENADTGMNRIWSVLLNGK